MTKKNKKAEPKAEPKAELSTVTNNSDVDITLHNGLVIPSGKTISIQNYESVKSHHVFSSWVDAGVLTVK